MDRIMKIIGIVAISVISVLLRGWVLTILWGWFLVPLGAKAITIPLALGLSGTIGMFTIDVKRERAPILEALVASIVVSILSLAIGSVYHLFV